MNQTIRMCTSKSENEQTVRTCRAKGFSFFVCPFTYCTSAVACVRRDFPAPSTFNSVTVYPKSLGAAGAAEAAAAAAVPAADVVAICRKPSIEAIRRTGARVNFKTAILRHKSPVYGCGGDCLQGRAQNLRTAKRRYGATIVVAEEAETSNDFVCKYIRMSKATGPKKQ
jgi:hypothetical protein